MFLFQPTTILTNLSRGNIPQEEIELPETVDVTIYQLSARGELTEEHIKPGKYNQFLYFIIGLIHKLR